MDERERHNEQNNRFERLERVPTDTIIGFGGIDSQWKGRHGLALFCSSEKKRRQIFNSQIFEMNLESLETSVVRS
jgi:hypothetical protein